MYFIYLFVILKNIYSVYNLILSYAEEKTCKKPIFSTF